MKLRRPCVAGYFYEASEERLRGQVGACLPKDRLPPQIALGGVVPHAGLMYSGPVAGSVYALVQLPPTVVLLGPNHRGEGAPFSVSSADAWETPIGRSEVDREFVKALLPAAPELEREDTAHDGEHSIEVQLPFLQCLGSGIKIVPIALGLQPFETYQRLGQELAGVVQAFPRKVLVLASSDMTHYEPHEVVREKDAEAIDAILTLDERSLMERIRQRDISMCGYAPTVAMLTCVKGLGATSARLVSYRTSGDSSGDYRAVVGYAGILIQ